MAQAPSTMAGIAQLLAGRQIKQAAAMATACGDVRLAILILQVSDVDYGWCLLFSATLGLTCMSVVTWHLDGCHGLQDVRLAILILQVPVFKENLRRGVVMEQVFKCESECESWASAVC